MNNTDSKQDEAPEFVRVQDVLKTVSEFCDGTEPFVGERFKKQLRNTIRAVPRASVAAPQGDGRPASMVIRNQVYSEIVTELCDPDHDIDPDNANIIAGKIADGVFRWLSSDAAASSSLPAEPPPNDSCSHWREGDSDNCVWCGDDLGPTTEADVAPPAEPLQPEGEQERRHPRLTNVDHQRIQETLDSLPECPTEEEAEAVLQACGTSGKEVVNEFIERLLRERSEMQAELDRLRASPPATPTDAAIRAAEEISDALLSGAITENQIGAIAEIFTRNLAPSASPEFASNYETVARQVVEGCSNWHDIQHKIVPRIVALLNTSETVELQIARRFLVKNGYERCASAACGCNSWHERRP